jgi:hypothetical protein
VLLAGGGNGCVASLCGATSAVATAYVDRVAADGSISEGQVGNMTAPRMNFGAVLLNDGRVLLVGGNSPDQSTLTATAELFNPATATFSPTGSMHVARSVEVATRLPDGRVAVGGYESGTATSTSLWFVLLRNL